MHRVADVGSEVILQLAEVVQKDLEEAFAADHLLGELTAQMCVLDTVPSPYLRQLLVCRRVQRRRASHRRQTEEARPIRLPAVEEEKRGWGGEVLAERVLLELSDRPGEICVAVDRLVPLDLAENDRRVADQIQAVVEPSAAPALQAVHRQSPLLEEVLAVGLAARARRVAEGRHVRLEELGVHIGLRERPLLPVGDVLAWQSARRHRPPSAR